MRKLILSIVLAGSLFGLPIAASAEIITVTGFPPEHLIGDTAIFALPLNGRVTILGDIAVPETILISINFSIEYYNTPMTWVVNTTVSSGFGPDASVGGDGFVGCFACGTQHWQSSQLMQITDEFRDLTITSRILVQDQFSFLSSYNISLYATLPVGLYIGAPVVPEPSTWAMLLIGFAGIGFMAYRTARV